jgi:hypothetical protein
MTSLKKVNDVRKNRARAIVVAVAQTRNPMAVPLVLASAAVATALSPTAGLAVVGIAAWWALAEG